MSAKTPYGALAWLLSELPPEQIANPVHVLRGLGTLLTRQAAGRRIVLAVDNAEEIDELGLLVTSQLCRQGTATLLATARELLHCGPEYIRLWSDGVLKRVDLGPLDPCQTAALLARTAGAPVTDLALRNIWNQSRGNPLLASLLCQDQIASGTLVPINGFWAWRGPAAYVGELPERVESGLRRLPAEQRRVVEILALARELPLDILLDLTDAEVVDTLEEAAVIVITAGARPAVRLCAQLQANVVAARMPFGRSRDLWRQVSGRMDIRQLSGPAAGGFAAWALASGSDQPVELALAAARWAYDTGDLGAVQKYVEAVPAEVRPAALVLAEAQALRAEGEHAGAYEVLAAHAARTGPVEGLEAGVQLAICRALAGSRLLRCAERPEDILDRAGSVLGMEENAGAKTAAASLQLVIARAELAVFHGRNQDLPARLADEYADQVNPVPARISAGLLLAQGHAAAGRLSLADTVATDILGWVPEAVLTTHDRERLFDDVLLLLIRTGDLAAAMELVRTAADPAEPTDPGGAGEGFADPGLQAAAGTELPAGVVHAYAGRGEAALACLLPAIAQLEAKDPEDRLPLAVAAAAYASALERDSATASGYLAADPAFRYRPPALVESAVRYFRLLAAEVLRKPDEADGSLAAFGDRALLEGNVTDALLGFAAGALQGDPGAVRCLAETARAAEGPLATMYADLAAGLLENSVPSLLAAGTRAMHLGNHRLGYSVALIAHDRAAAQGDRAGGRRARYLENECFRMLSAENTIRRALRRLTDFERDLVLRAAAGESSSALGRTYHLSPRTVDWHLGRIFSRLHVAGRTELRDLLAGTDGQKGAGGPDARSWQSGRNLD